MSIKGIIRIAPVHGFCSGVQRAVSLVNKAVAEGPEPVRVLHEIVHNQHIVSELKTHGVEFYDEPSPEWCGGTVIFSAHGVSTALENKTMALPVHVIDATCPLVKQIHRHAVDLEKKGFSILFIGKRHHRETQGVVGRLKKEPVVLETPEDSLKFVPSPGIRYACLTQTTLSQDECAGMLQILKEKIPDLEIRSGICTATSARQNAVKVLAKSCPRIIVIGDSASSNSRRLCETARAAGAEALLAPDASSIPPSFYEKAGDIGLTSGASAPEYLLNEVIVLLQKEGFELED